MKRKLILHASLTILLLSALVLIPKMLNENYQSTLQKYFSFSSDIQSGLKDTVIINRLNKAAFNIRLTDPRKTVNLADSALFLAKKLNYYFGIAEANRIKGVGFYYLSDTEQAVKNYIEALKYFKTINDKKNEARVYNNFGNLYKEINYNKALLYYKKALSIAKKLNIDEFTAGIYLNIATVLRFQGDYKNSLKYLEISKEIFAKTRDTINFITSLQNSGVIYYKLKDFETAKKQLFEAISQAKKNNLSKVIVGSNLALASIYLEQTEYFKAEASINEGIKYARGMGDNNSVYYYLHKAYELELKRRNYSKALKYLKEVHHHDSLQLSRNLSDNIGKTSSHYLQLQKIQKNELIITQQKYKETQYWWFITLIISILLLAALIGIVIFSFSQKRKQKKELKIQNTIATLEQKALQAMMNPHFVFNVINTIQYFIGIKESKAANQILTGFARLMRKHLEICLKSNITLFEEIQYLNLYLSLEKIRFDEKMNFYINIDSAIEVEEIIIPSMLIQPFIENAVWHGLLPKEDGGWIQINFTCIDNLLRIKIIDNGIGISNSSKSKTPSQHTSRGLELIHERVHLLNKINKTSIHITQTQTGASGTEVIITIPI
ncbi:tetratricopeptide repeat protein [Daejeonella sp.]|uniref:tetratricopeptide repeat-containing sensor histidine kinase n=1 Tax=Daejeonella sp. TaxID=2805397 RepID=UPI0027303D8A|nr:tetratricopeptide repeat protein [Daejeonella sp.]MDP2413448.1 tetratricopeptide repeat protein [Daejeonella sp.]